MIDRKRAIEIAVQNEKIRQSQPIKKKNKETPKRAVNVTPLNTGKSYDERIKEIDFVEKNVPGAYAPGEASARKRGLVEEAQRKQKTAGWALENVITATTKQPVRKIGSVLEGAKQNTSVYSPFKENEQYVITPERATQKIAELEKKKADVDRNLYKYRANTQEWTDTKAAIDKEIEETKDLYYKSLMRNKDFKEKSAYKGIKKGQIGKDNRLYEQVVSSKYLTTDSGKIIRPLSIDDERLNGTQDDSYFYMNDREFATYSYLYNSGDKKGATEYLKSIESDLHQRKIQKDNEFFYEVGQESPVLATTGSFLKTLVEPVESIETGVKALTGNLEANDIALSNSRSKNMLRQGVTDNINNPVGELLYKGLTGAVDNAIRFGTAKLIAKTPVRADAYLGKHVKGLTQEAVNKMIGTAQGALMGSSTVVNAMSDSLARGDSYDKAVIIGAVRGSIEYLTEKFSVEALLKNPTTVKVALGKAFVAEGSEELFSGWANMILDEAAYGDISGKYKEYIEQGMTKEGAFGQAALDFALESGENFIVGGLSGFGMTAAGAGVDTARYEGGVRLYGGAVKSDIPSMIHKVKTTFAKDSDIYKKADEIEKKINNGEKVRNKEAGEFAAQYYEEYEKYGEDIEQKYEDVTQVLHDDLSSLGFTSETTAVSPSSFNSQPHRSERSNETTSGRQESTADNDSIPQDASGVKENIKVNSEQYKSMIRSLGKAGAEVYPYAQKIMSNVNPNMSEGEMLKSFNRVYLYALNGRKKEDVYKRWGDDIGQMVIETAYAAGVRDRKTNLKALKENKKNIKAAENSGVVKNSNSNVLSDEYFEKIDTMAKAFGVSVELADSVVNADGKEVNGEYSGSNIKISMNKLLEFGNADEAALWIAKHEITHRIQELAPKEYLKFRDIAYKMAEADNRTNVSSAEKEAIKRSLDLDSSIDEVVADYVGNKKFIERVSNEQPTIAKQIRDILRDILDKVGIRKYNELERMYRMWDKAVKAAEKTAKKAVKGDSTDGKVKYSYDGMTKSGIRKYTSDFPEGMSESEKVKIFKDRIATIFNLGAVRLKTDTKRIEVKGDKFTALKNIYGDENISDIEMNAKINSLYDLADILANSKFDGVNIEESYKDTDAKPKNKAHKDVKYWYKFSNRIYLDNELYDVTFNIRDKGKEQYQYLITFKSVNKKVIQNSHTASERPPANITESPIDTSLSQNKPIVNSYDMQNNKKNSEGDLKDLIKPDIDAIIEENNKLRHINQYLKNAFRDNEEFVPRAKDIGRLIRNHAYGYNGGKKLVSEFTNLYKEIKQAVSQNNNELWAKADEHLRDIAMDIVSNTVVKNDTYYKSIKELRDYLRNRRIYIDPKYMGDFDSVGGYNNFRKHNMGRFYLSTQNGVGIDVMYEEIQSVFGNILPEAYTPADMVMAISDFYDSMAVVYENPYDANIEEAAQAMYYELWAGIETTVRETGKSKDAQRINALEKIEIEMRQSRDRAIQKAREGRDRQIKAFRDKMKKDAQRKADYNTRVQLLKTARRLKAMSRTTTPQNQAAINEVLQGLDTAAVSITGKKLDQLSQLRAEYKRLQAEDKTFEDPYIEERLKRLEQKRISEIKEISEVEDLLKVLQTIEHQIRTGKRLSDIADARETGVIAAETMNNIKNAKGRDINGYLAGCLSPIRMIEKITGYVDDDGLYLRAKAIQEGQRKKFDFLMRAEKMFQNFTGDKKFMKSITGKDAEVLEYEVTDYENPEQKRTIEITKGMRISLYLHSRSYANMAHVENGGIIIPDIDLYRKGKTEEAFLKGETVILKAMDVRRITASMSNTERSYADKVFEYFNTVSREEINKVSLADRGYEAATAKNYYPIETKENAKGEEYIGLKKTREIENPSFLEERTDGTGAIYLKDVTTVLNSYMQGHAKYIGFTIPVRNFNKVLKNYAGEITMTDKKGKEKKYKTVEEIIGAKWGIHADHYIKKLITDLKGATVEERNVVLRYLEKLHQNHTFAALFLNLKVAGNQIASLPSAIPEVGYKALLRSMFSWGRVDTELIARYTPLQYMRTKGVYDSTVEDMVKGNSKIPGKLDLMTYTDKLVTRKLWKASVYNVRMNQKELEIGSTDFYEAVADVYNRVMENTQPNTSLMERPEFLRGGQFMRMIMVFKGEPLKNFNLQYEAVDKFSAKKRQLELAKMTKDKEKINVAEKEYKAARSNLVMVTTSQVITAFVYAAECSLFDILRGSSDDYEDEEGDMTILSWLKGTLISGGLSIVTEVPFADCIVNAVSSLFLDKRFYTPNLLGLESIESLYNTAESAVKLIQAEVNGSSMNWREKIKLLDGMADNIGTLIGAPAATVTRSITSTLATGAKIVVKNKYIGEYIAEKIRLNAVETKVSKNGAESLNATSEVYDILYKAVKKNDKKAYDSIIKDLMNMGVGYAKILSAVKSRANDDENFNYSKSLGAYAMLENAGVEEEYEKYIEKADELGISEDILSEATELIDSGEKYKVMYNSVEKFVESKGLNEEQAEYLLEIARGKYSVNDLTYEQAGEYAQINNNVAMRLFDEIDVSGRKDYEQRKIYEKIYDYAAEYALEKASDGEYVMTREWQRNAKNAKKLLGVSTAEFIVLYEEYGKSLYSTAALVSHELDYDVGTYLDFYSKTKGIEGEDKQERFIQALKEMDISDEERAYLFSTQYKSNKNNPWARSLRVNYKEYTEKKKGDK